MLSHEQILKIIERHTNAEVLDSEQRRFHETFLFALYIVEAITDEEYSHYKKVIESHKKKGGDA